MGRFVSATGQFLLATSGQFSCPPVGSSSCPLTTGWVFDPADLADVVRDHPVTRNGRIARTPVSAGEPGPPIGPPQQAEIVCGPVPVRAGTAADELARLADGLLVHPNAGQQRRQTSAVRPMRCSQGASVTDHPKVMSSTLTSPHRAEGKTCLRPGRSGTTTA